MEYQFDAIICRTSDNKWELNWTDDIFAPLDCHQIAIGVFTYNNKSLILCRNWQRDRILTWSTAWAKQKENVDFPNSCTNISNVIVSKRKMPER